MTVEFVMENLEKYTYPNIKKQIQSIEIKNPILAVSVRKDDNLIGLCLAEYDSDQPVSEIFSFYIDPDYRNKGIGNEMLLKTEQILQHKGFKAISCYYWSSWPSFEATKHILTKQGYSEPEKLMHVFKTDIERVAKIPWKENVVLPEELEIVQWSWVSPDEKAELLNEQEINPFFPAYLSPFSHEDKIAYYTSLALKKNDKVVGWLMTYWNDRETLEYNNLFIKKEHRESLKIPMEMIKTASMLQVQQGVHNILWSVGQENPQLESYFDGKFGDYSDKATIYRSVKNLE